MEGFLRAGCKKSLYANKEGNIIDKHTPDFIAQIKLDHNDIQAFERRSHRAWKAS
jgi:hypothetical protein